MIAAYLARAKQYGWLRTTALVLAFLFPVLAFVVSDAGSAILFFLFVTGIILVARRSASLNFSKQEWLLVATFMGYFTVGVFCYLVGVRTRLGWEILFRDIRFVFVVPAFAALVYARLPKHWVRSSLVLGGCAVGVIAAIQLALHGAGWRASGATISIVYGHISAGLAVSLAIWLWTDRARWAWLGVFGWVFASLASGTRGSWLILSVAVVIAVVVAAREAVRSDSRMRLKWKRLAVALILSVILAVPLRTFIGARVQHAYQGWRLYLTGTELTASTVWDELGCPTDSRFFSALKKFVRTGGHGKATVHIESNASPDAGFCETSKQALVIKNVANKRSIWFTVPVTDGYENESHVIFALKGAGRIVMSRHPTALLTLNSRTFQKYSLPVDSRVENRIVGRLGANQSLHLIPMKTWPGQYDFIYADSSVGKRLDMWSAAFKMFKENPLIGLGPGGFKKGIADLANRGKVPKGLQKFDHAHNDILTFAVDRGLVGVFAYLMLLGIPAWIGYRGWRAGKSGLGLALITLVASTAISGLTETMFNHSSVITYYGVIISILVAALKAETTDDRKLAE